MKVLLRGLLQQHLILLKEKMDIDFNNIKAYNEYY